MLIGSLVELHVGLHSCLCFSHLKKLVLNAGSTPPRYLAVCRASSAFSNRNPDSFSIPGGSIENGFASSIAFHTWWIDQASVLDSVGLFLDTSSIPQLSTTIFSIPPSIDFSILLDTCIYRDLLLALFKLPMRFGTHFTRPLSRYFSLFSPKHSHLTPIFVLQGFFKLFQEFLLLVSF